MTSRNVPRRASRTAAHELDGASHSSRASRRTRPPHTNAELLGLEFVAGEEGMGWTVGMRASPKGQKRFELSQPR
jgi:hypothetical protein